MGEDSWRSGYDDWKTTDPRDSEPWPGEEGPEPDEEDRSGEFPDEGVEEVKP